MTAAAESARPASFYVAYPHLTAGIIAIVAFFGSATAVFSVERERVSARAGAMVPMVFTEKWKGEAVPRALLRRADVLPLYGSSELVVDMPNRATEFFSTYPTGFAVAPIGDRAYPMLAMAIGLGSLGQRLRGKRVVLSLSGTWFVGDDTLHDAKIFRNHYSELQAGDLLFFGGLPIELKRRVAKRTLEYSEVTSDFPLLNPVLGCLARQCRFESVLPAFIPIWAARGLFLHIEDNYRVARVAAGGRDPIRRPTAIDWLALESRADAAWRASSASNHFGIADSIWTQYFAAGITRTRGNMPDTVFRRGVEQATVWEDLDILLATLKATGARPLILNSPLKGVWWDYRGVTPASRQRFYERFAAVAARYGFPAENFASRDSDPYFISESRSHLSPKGWAVYDRTLNAFYHDSLH